MKHLNLPADLVAAETVLFLGSGFAHGAMAINHKGLPLGGELDNRLAEELGLPADRYQGKTLAQIASKRPREFLKNFLTENCTVRSYKAFHANILSREWFRVYTTNFDNLGEVIRSENGRNNDPLTFRDPIPNKIDRDSIIHLHGYIGRVTEGNAPTEIIYALNAYAGLHSERPEWFA